MVSVAYDKISVILYLVIFLILISDRMTLILTLLRTLIIRLGL
jgi:hypothetical protein